MRGLLGQLKLAAVVLLLGLWLLACGQPLATPAPVFLQAVGSTSMAPLVSRLAAAFHDRFPLVTIDVDGLGTRLGLEALAAGEADVAMASWLPEDLGSKYRATAIARDGLAVIVHPSNPVEGLGLLSFGICSVGEPTNGKGWGGNLTRARFNRSAARRVREHGPRSRTWSWKGNLLPRGPSWLPPARPSSSMWRSIPMRWAMCPWA